VITTSLSGERSRGVRRLLRLRRSRRLVVGPWRGFSEAGWCRWKVRTLDFLP